MAVTIHINGVSNSLAHKGASGFARCTVPDVCKTPSPGGPVPVPYPVIISMSNALQNGTKTVKVDGGNMAAVKGSELSRCNGDEPGTAGGVTSSTNMKEAKWLLYSFDVKLEGENACRLGDMMTMNHGNTVCLSGYTQMPVEAKNLLEDIATECECNTPPEENGKKKDCGKLGEDKHKCCEEKIQEHIKSGKDPKLQGEQGYWNPLDNRNKGRYPNFDPEDESSFKMDKLQEVKPTRAQLKGFAKKLMGDLGIKFRDAMRMACKGKKFPDAAAVHPDGSKSFADFKFDCPEGHPYNKAGDTAAGNSNLQLSGRQKAAFDAMGKMSCNGKSTTIKPKKKKGKDC